MSKNENKTICKCKQCELYDTNLDKCKEKNVNECSKQNITECDDFLVNSKLVHF